MTGFTIDVVNAAAVTVLAIGLPAAAAARRPVVRSAILRATLVATVLCPVASAAMKRLGTPAAVRVPTLSVEARPRERGVEPAVQAPAERHGAEVADVGVAVREQPVRRPVEVVSTAPPLRRLLPYTVAVAWLAGSSLLVARLIVAYLMITRARRSAMPAGAAVREAFDRVAREMGVRTPAVLLTRRVGVPCVVGWIWPAILLPGDAAAVEREVLVHELAHVRRGDCAWQLLAHLVRAAVWFQPLAWALTAALERAAEEACDDLVLHCGGDGVAYAGRLAALAEGMQVRWAAGAGVGVVGVRSLVSRRIARLLDAALPRATRLSRRAWAGLAGGAAIVTLGIGIIRAESGGNAEAPKPAAAVASRAGRVLDAEGRPVGKAEVWLVRDRAAGPQVVEATTADAEGRFNLTHAAPGNDRESLQVEAYAPGRGIGACAYKPTAPYEVRLKPATRIALTLLDPEGKPVAGLRVYPRRFFSAALSRLGSGNALPTGLTHFFASPALSDRLAGVTDAEGSVTLRDLPRDSRFDLGFDDGRFAYSDLGGRISTAERDDVSPPATVRLERAATIAGVARYGSTGQPAAGMEVTVQATSRNWRHGWGRAVTGADGSYRVSHLLAGEYNVMLDLGKEGHTEWAAAAHEWVKVSGGQALAGVDFTLISGGVVRGTVTAADTGKPFAGTLVGLHGPARPRSSAAVHAVETGPDGSYSVRVPPGVQHVYLMGLLPQAYRPEQQEMFDVTVAEGQSVTLDFKVPRREGRAVDGTVVGVDGRPAAGVPVRAQTWEEVVDAFDVAMTDERGRFHFDALPDGTPLSVRWHDVGTADIVVVGKEPGELRIQLVPRVKRTVTGLVTDEAGRPIRHPRVRLTEWAGRFGSGESEPRIGGDNGRYEIRDLYADTRYSIAVEGDGFGEQQANVKLDEQALEQPTLKLPRAGATVGGVVVDEDGKPLAGVVVHMSDGAPPKQTTTDAQGRFSFAVVAGSSHLIWVAPKEEARLGPHANGVAGRDDVRLVVPREDR